MVSSKGSARSCASPDLRAWSPADQVRQFRQTKRQSRQRRDRGVRGRLCRDHRPSPGRRSPEYGQRRSM